MQTLPKVKSEPMLAAGECSLDNQGKAVRDVTGVLLIATVVSAVAIEAVKILGWSNGMDDHTRMILSYVGLAICFFSAPTILIFGRKMSLTTGLMFGGAVIFGTSLIASLIV